jgi:large subunit ribosomal protein L24
MAKRRTPTDRPRHRLHVKKGDRVEILSGNARGATGVVKAVDTKHNRVIVEGVNVRKRHMRPSQRYPQGGIIEREAPIHASNVRVTEGR